jgi:hypothetical protein
MSYYSYTSHNNSNGGYGGNNSNGGYGGNNSNDYEEDDDEYDENDDEDDDEEDVPGEDEDYCTCGQVCLAEDGLCSECMEQNQYFTLFETPTGWTDLRYTDEGAKLIRDSIHRRQEATMILQELGQDYPEFYYLYENYNVVAKHQIQVILGRAYSGH